MANQVLYGGFRRLKNFALDPTSTFKTKYELERYLSLDGTAYKGQQIVVWGDEEPKNNGTYTVVPVLNEDGTSTNTVTIEKTLDIETVRTEITNDLETDIAAATTNIEYVANSLGITLSNKPGQGPSESSNVSILERVNAIEKILALKDEPDSDPEDIKNAISDLWTELGNVQNNIINSETLAGMFASRAELDAVKELLNKLDDGDPETEFQEYLEKIEELRKSIDEVLNPSTMTSFDVLLINSKHLKNLVYNIMESGEKDENGETANSKLPLIRKSIEEVRSSLNALISANATAITAIQGTLTSHETLINSKLDTSTYTEYTETTASQLAAISKNISKGTFFNFNDSETWMKLPTNITITDIRFIIDNASYNQDLMCQLVIDGVTNVISPDLDEVYFDEAAEFIIERTIVIDDVERTLRVYPKTNGGVQSSFDGAYGRVYINYYEN